MSNLIINVRLWCIHFQMTDRYKPRLSWNKSHLRNSKVFEVHEWDLSKGGTNA